MSEKQLVRIHIDQKPYHSPNPTDGEALYALGNVNPGLELYQEVSGNREDKPIPRSKEHIHLKEDDHFHSGEPHKKVFTIIVNGRPKQVSQDSISFEQVVALSGLPNDQNTIFTVTYKRGVDHASGEMVAGDTVRIKDGMIFNVTPTNKS